jgi:hypothetical protein
MAAQVTKLREQRDQLAQEALFFLGLSLGKCDFGPWRAAGALFFCPPVKAEWIALLARIGPQ